MTRGRTTRERLLDAAAEILEEEGLERLNTNAIAARAGVTPPTVYRNFRNKEDVLVVLAHRFLEAEQAWLSGAENSITQQACVASAVSTLIEGYWESARRHRGIVALRNAMRVSPALREVEEQSLQSSTATVSDVLLPLLPKLTDQQRMRTARYIVEMVCSAVDRCYTLAHDEQDWRIAKLKRSVTAFVAAEAAQ
jgi:AcrR family transcriptional regulator